MATRNAAVNPFNPHKDPVGLTISALPAGAGPSGRPDGQPGLPDQNLLQMLLPRDGTDARMFAAVATVRLLLMPALSLALVRGLAALSLLPADPVCALTLLVQVRRYFDNHRP